MLLLKAVRGTKIAEGNSNTPVTVIYSNYICNNATLLIPGI